MAFLALVFAMGGFAVAANQSATSAKVVKACHAKKTGVLRVLKPGKRCRRSERALSWNRSGRPGPAGSAGAAGTAGSTGADGAAGPAGAQGPAGSDAQFDGAAAGGVLTGTFPTPGLATDSVGAAQLASTAVKYADLGIQSAVVTSPSNPDSPKSVTASCPTGTQILSGSASVIEASNGVPLNVALSQSSFGLNSWIAAAFEPNAYGGNWAVQAAAVCIRS